MTTSTTVSFWWFDKIWVKVLGAERYEISVQTRHKLISENEMNELLVEKMKYDVSAG